MGGGTAVAVLGLAALAAVAVAARGPLTEFVQYFSAVVDDLGPAGYLAYGLVYAGLEVLAVPAIPLTMTAGVVFGVVPGTAVVSAAATAAATASFLIARYAAREKVQAYAAKSPRFAAVDRAIGRDGLRVVTLLRLSPLLPLAASSYLYGLTSVELGPYVLGSWLGMLPGTVAYVAAGSYGRALLRVGEAVVASEAGSEGGVSSSAAAAMGGGGAVQPWQVALGLALSAASLGYVGRLATKALEEAAEEIEAEEREKERNKG
jgi:uncharacterized membrane protein YdjX (TVP38/TMEM64 family)